MHNMGYAEDLILKAEDPAVLAYRAAAAPARSFPDGLGAVRRRHRALAHLVLLRPQQWTKNFLVLAPLLFADQLFVRAQLVRAVAAFVAFCLVSSGTYVVNDLLDRDADRAHPRKRRRPIASGEIRPGAAVVAALGLFAAGFAAAARQPQLLLCLAGYVALQAAYGTALKKAVILDVMAIAAGFVLRAITGAVAIEVVVSPWLLICTILLALFLALSKRRSELLATNRPGAHRRVLDEYSLALLDQLIAVVTSCTLLAYILYTFSDQTAQKFPSHLMPATLPFVLYGMFRYLYLIYKKAEGGEPEILLLRDRPLLINVALWGISVAVIASLD